MVVSQSRPPGDLKRVAKYGSKAREALRGLNSHTSVTLTWSDSEPVNAAAAALSHTICKHMCRVHLAGSCLKEKNPITKPPHFFILEKLSFLYSFLTTDFTSSGFFLNCLTLLYSILV